MKWSTKLRALMPHQWRAVICKRLDLAYVYNESSSKLTPQPGQCISVSSAYTNFNPNILLHLGHLIPRYTNNIPTTNTDPEPSDIILNNCLDKYLSKNATIANMIKLIPTIIK